MSVLSPVAQAILGNLKSFAKDGNKSDNPGFLSLLGTGANTADTLPRNHSSTRLKNEEALIDVLHEKDAPPSPPPAVPIEDKPILSTNQRDEPRHERTEIIPAKKSIEDGERREPSRTEAKEKQPAIAEKKPVKAEGKQPTGNEAKPADHVAQANKKINASTDSDTDSGEGNISADSPIDQPLVTSETVSVAAADTLSPLAQKISEKINQLSDLLASVAALLGVNPGAQIASVNITSTTLTISQQDLQVNQPFVDLSNRFQQLIAAISAGQDVPVAAQQSLALTFSSFQSLSLSAYTALGDESFNPETLLAQCKECASHLSLSIEGLKQSPGLTGSQELADGLQKLHTWLNDFEAIALPRKLAPSK